MNNYYELKKKSSSILLSTFLLLLSIFPITSCSSIKGKDINYNEISDYLYNHDENDYVCVYSIKNGNKQYRNSYYHYIISKVNESIIIYIDFYDDTFDYLGYYEYVITNNSILYTKRSIAHYTDGKHIVYDGVILDNSFINNSYRCKIADESDANKPAYATFKERIIKQNFTDKELITPSTSCLEVKFKSTFIYNSPDGYSTTQKQLENESFLYKRGPVTIEVTDTHNKVIESYTLRQTITFQEFLKLQGK